MKKLLHSPSMRSLPWPPLETSSLLLLLALSALFLPSTGQAQESWTFDPTFQRTPLFITSESASGVHVLQSGKVLINTINGGLLSGANGARIGALIRVDGTTGAIDSTWHPDPTLTGFGFLGVAEAPDGKIYYSTALVGELAESGTNRGDPAINRLIRLNSDGSRDTSFNSPIFAFAARFLAVQPDGKIIVCSGGIALIGVPQAGSIVQTVRLNTNGSLDTTFKSPNFQMNPDDPPANVATGNFYDTGVFGNPVIDATTGKIYFCGIFKYVNGLPRLSVVRCNVDGTVDSSFVPTGLNEQGFVRGRAMVLQPGGKIVVGSNALQTAAGGSTRYALLRFNNDGSLDPSFTLFPTTDSSGRALVPGYTGPIDIHALPDGKILTSGQVRVLRFVADGALDPAFTPLDYSSPNYPDAFLGGFHFDVSASTGAAYMTNPNRLYTRLGGIAVDNITKLNPDGTINTQFKSPLVNSEDFSPDLHLASSGALYLTGSHTDFGATANATITRLQADGTRDTSYSLGTLPFADKQAEGFALLSDSSAYVLYHSGSFSGGYQFSNLVHLSSTGAIDTSFRLSSALQTSLSVNAFDGTDTTKVSLPLISTAPGGEAYVFTGGDAQATVNANGNLKPVRIKTNGTENTSVPALGFPVGEVTRDSSGNLLGGSTGYLQRLAQTTDGGFVLLVSVAPFPTSTGAPYNYRILKLKADGSTDTSFNSPLIVSTADSLQNFPLLTDPVTGLFLQPVNGFYSEGDVPVSGATLFSDGSVILAGNFLINSVNYQLAKLTAAGALDTSFQPPLAQNVAQPARPAVVTGVRVAPDSKIWLLGRFDTVGGKPAPGVARLNPNGTLDTTFQVPDVSFYDSVDNRADVTFTGLSTAYLRGTFRHNGETMPYAVTRIENTSPPAITSPLSATATIGQPFVYQIIATNHPTSFTATKLPAGLVFNSTLGVVSGQATTAGTYSVPLGATNASGTGSATLTLTVETASSPIIIISGPATGRTGEPFTYQIRATGIDSAAVFSATGLPAGLSVDAATGVISGTTESSGVFAVRLSVSDAGQAASVTVALTFTSDLNVPIIQSPDAVIVVPGEPFLYQIEAPSGADPTDDPTIYSIVGELPPGLTFDPATGTISGDLTNLATHAETAAGEGTGESFTGKTILAVVQVFATNSHGTATKTLVFLQAVPQLLNISTRLNVLTGDNVLIGGFIVTGTEPKKVILRGIGPSLNVGGVPLTGALQDTVLELHNASTLIKSNDNWQSDQKTAIEDSGVAPTDSKESAIVATLEPGSYTAIVHGKGNATGIALVEIYDLDASGASHLANVSTRGKVEAGDNAMIGGVIVGGDTPANVLVRAIGPSLTDQGVAGALQDTTLELHSSNGDLLASNDDWQSDQKQKIIDTTVPPADPRESAILRTLAPGAYTAVVRGKNDSTGVALVEGYIITP